MSFTRSKKTVRGGDRVESARLCYVASRPNNGSADISDRTCPVSLWIAAGRGCTWVWCDPGDHRVHADTAEDANDSEGVRIADVSPSAHDGSRNCFNHRIPRVRFGAHIPSSRWFPSVSRCATNTCGHTKLGRNVVSIGDEIRTEPPLPMCACWTPTPLGSELSRTFVPVEPSTDRTDSSVTPKGK